LSAQCRPSHSPELGLFLTLLHPSFTGAQWRREHAEDWDKGRRTRFNENIENDHKQQCIPASKRSLVGLLRSPPSLTLRTAAASLGATCMQNILT